MRSAMTAGITVQKCAAWPRRQFELFNLVGQADGAFATGLDTTAPQSYGGDPLPY